MGATRLFSTASVEEQWSAVVGPWLRAQAGTAWKNSKPTVVLTPSRAESFYLRSRLVAEGRSFLGLRFWTPSDARKFLLAELAPDIGTATQAELRLVARVCAAKCAAESTSNHATLASVVRDPGPFLRAYDLLLGAGWNPAKDGADYGRELAREMQRALEKFPIATQAGVHRQLWRQAGSLEKSPLASALVVGFNATHWPLWDLLKAVVFSAGETVVALSEPRVFAEEIDQLWISSWEEVTQTESVIPTSPPGSNGLAAPFANLVASYEKGARPSDLDMPDLTFCVTPDLGSHIRAVVLQALDYLRQDSCTRLGIVFPEANALALGVANELQRLSVPLDDGTGSLVPSLFERRCWQAWIALQNEPGVARLITWLRACEAQGVSSGLASTFSARRTADVLNSALSETLVDDLHFLAGHLEERLNSESAAAVAKFLRHRVALPEEATFAGFMALTRKALALPGWEAYLARLDIDPPQWLLDRSETLSRRTFLVWLKDSTMSQVRTRGPDGNHFYGRVHLVVYAQMTGQTWSHLILTGLNEGVWPRVFEAGAFGSRHELAELNRQARTLNQRSSRQGGQGMGHETVGADRGHCLLPLERRELALRDLCAALESVTVAASLTAMTTETGRNLLPSDFFSHAWQANTGRVLDEKTFQKLAAATGEWCRRHEFLFAPEFPAQSLTVMTTRTAYLARRDPTRPFGPYEFACEKPPQNPIQLSCKTWEDAWNNPAATWLEKIVGASPWPEGALSWPQAVGIWAHRWLGTALKEWNDEKSAAEFQVLIWAAADRDAARVRNHARAAGIELYPWWEQVWGQARTAALGLGETLGPLLPGRPFLSEFTLPGDMIALPGSKVADFELRGRIDFLFVEPGATPCDLASEDFSGCTCWVIDFKTGAAQKLSANRIGNGKGLQTVLYALAVQARGARSTTISLHTGDAPLTPQIQLNEIVGIAPIFRSLEIFHRDGVFGTRADIDNAYGYAPTYPIATRLVPKAIVQAKWALVHGAAPGNGEETE